MGRCLMAQPLSRYDQDLLLTALATLRGLPRARVRAGTVLAALLQAYRRHGHGHGQGQGQGQGEGQGQPPAALCAFVDDLLAAYSARGLTHGRREPDLLARPRQYLRGRLVALVARAVADASTDAAQSSDAVVQ